MAAMIIKIRMIRSPPFTAIRAPSHPPIDRPTVKMRAGWDKNNIIISQAGPILEDCGIKAITLHARTSKQLYTGKANWDLIKELKNSVNIPVIGNGDVKNIDDYHSILNQTKCDAVMIGRAALGNPWIFKNIQNSIEGIAPLSISIKDIIKTCLKHISLLEKYKTSIACLNLSKKHINYYLKNFENSSNYRKELMRCSEIDDIKKILGNII